MQDLKSRTKRFALDVIKFVSNLPKNHICNTLGNQLLRAGTSIGANYRAATRAKSKADFNYKIKVVEEESDESIYWLELITESGLVDSDLTTKLLKEANELTAIFSSISIKNKKDR